MQVHLEHVSKRFKQQQVLRNISLDLEGGEIFGLIGPSGAGKTTLIRLITGSLSADSGTVRMGELTIPSRDALRQIGYMPQNDALYTDLSGYDNLLFFGGMYGLSSADLKERVRTALRLVDLEPDEKKLVGAYSGGMKKRLSLAAALLPEPSVLILDEPTVGIDPLLRQKIWEQFRTLKAQGRTILITTHVMDEASLCDRVALLYHGRVIACDRIDALLARTEHHAMEELFLESGVTEA